MKQVQSNLSRILGEKRITQAQLSRQTGISKNAISVIYHDKWSRVYRRTINALCNALDVDPGQLFDLVDEDDTSS